MSAEFRPNNPFQNANYYAVAIAITLPIFVFSAQLPRWLPAIGVACLLTLYVVRSLAIGRLFHHTPASIPLCILLLLLPVNLATTPLLETTLPLVYSLIGNIALFSAVASLHRETWFLQLLPFGICITSILFCIFILLWSDFDYGRIPLIGSLLKGLIPSGLQSFWDADGINPNSGGAIAGVFWVPSLVWLGFGRNPLLKLLAFISISCASLLIFLSATRGSLLGIGVALFALIFLKLPYKPFVAIVGLTAAGLFLSTIDLETILGDANASGALSPTGRIEVWSRAIYMARDYPLAGIGLGNFELILDTLYPTVQVPADVAIPHTHDLYMQPAVEMGIPAAVAYISFFLILAVALIRRIQNIPLDQHVTALALFGSLITFLAHGLVDYPILNSPLTAPLGWTLFGSMMVVALADLSNTRA